MDGCLICGVQHTGSCNPQHPAHRPLSAAEWAAREAAAQHNAEKEDSMNHDDTRKADEEYLIMRGIQPEREPAVYKPPLWERVAEAAAAVVEKWQRPVEEQELIKRGIDPYAHGHPHDDTRKADEEARIGRESAPQSEPDPPRGKWPILCRAGAVSPGDTIEPAAGRWFTVVELGAAPEPPEDQAGIRPYGTGREPGEQWQTAYCRDATLPEIHAAQKSQRQPEAGPQRRYDVETPGPTEAAGGSFQVFHSKEAAAQAAGQLPQSQTAQLDQVVTSNGPTKEYVLTSLPRPEDVAVDKRVEEQIQQLEDPRQRAEAERLMRIIREEPAPRQERQREQEAEMER